MAARNVAAADSVRQAVLADTPAATLDVMELDLSSVASVRKFAADFDAKGLPLNILVYAPCSPNSRNTTPVHFRS
jgi:WW domain-containing oxidoreductase